MSRPERYYNFVSACLSERSKIAPEELVRQMNSCDWDWERLVATAAREKVLPTLWGRMRVLGVASQLPADISEFFRALEELSLERNQVVLKELVTIGTALNSIEIEPVLLKGAAYLVSGIYSDISARLLADIDLLVPSSALARAVEVLRSAGYAGDYDDPFPSLAHHYPMLRRAAGPGIEIHHALGLGACPAILPASEVLAHSEARTFGGARFRLPSSEHLIVHHIMHSQVHHHYPGRVWPSLRTMYDLALLSGHFGEAVDWVKVESRFRQNGHSGTFTLHLATVHDVLQLELPGAKVKGGLTRVRWYRRKALRSFPAMRWLDPAYLFSSTLLWRGRRLARMLKAPGGLRHVLTTPFRWSFYQNLRQELSHLPDRQIS